VNCGLPLVAHAWTKAEYRWEVEPTGLQLNKCFPDRPKPVGRSYATRPKNGILKQDPVDILISDHSRDDGRQLMKKGGPIWLPWLQHCPDGKRPAVIIETWSSAEATDPNGAFSKVHRKRMSQYGYSQCSRQVELTSVGSAVDQTRLVIVYSRLSSPIAARLNLDLSKGAMPGIVA
jgi:hypothetical protein